MNKEQRKQLNLVIDTLANLREEIEAIRQEEEDKKDNLPENMQDGEKASKYEQCIDNLQSAIDSIEEAESSITDAME